MSSYLLLETSVLLLLIGAVIAFLCARNRILAGWVSLVFVLAAAIAQWAVVVRTFARGAAEPEVSLAAVAGLGSRFAVSVDPLSAFFIAIASTVSVLSTLYSIRYMTQFKEDGVAKFYPALLVFFAAILGVLATSDFLFFLVFWELMTLTSFFLVTFESRSKASQRAGLKYFLMTHAAALCLVVAALLLWRRSGSFQFAALAHTLADLVGEQPALAHVILFLFFIGFATKAGILPMGDWLPDAHPAAPSGVSAALSGVLVKLGIYGLVRVFCGFLPASQATDIWGVLLAFAGTVSLFVGTLTALKQHDAKRLMAFHTIGQIGYICLGLGVGLACLRTDPALAALSLMGSLFHAANHACFKSCLFLGAGSVLYRTGHRDVEKLGGLAEFMPVTAGSSVVASLSIAGIPPLNGFASKWLILATCILAGLRSPMYLLLGLVGMLISLATLASFMKVLGAVFLGSPKVSPKVDEVPVTMAVPQVVLAGLCIVLGLFPYGPLSWLRDAVAGILQAPVPSMASLTGGPWSVSLAPSGVAVAFWGPLAIGVILAILTALAYSIQRAGAAEVRSVPVWTCGEEHESRLVRYPPSSFCRPLIRQFQGIYPSLRAQAPRFPGPLRKVLDVDTWLYFPLVRSVDRTARTVSRSHVGVPQVYLLWIVIGAILVVTIMLAVGR